MVRVKPGGVRLRVWRHLHSDRQAEALMCQEPCCAHLECRLDKRHCRVLCQLAAADTQVFHVERLLKERTGVGGRQQFLVRWAGYTAEYDSWEFEENIIAGAEALITQLRGGVPPTPVLPPTPYVVPRRRAGSKRIALTGSLEHWTKERRCTPSGRKYDVYNSPQGKQFFSRVAAIREAEMG
jgi:hypothetical protein